MPFSAFSEKVERCYKNSKVVPHTLNKRLVWAMPAHCPENRFVIASV